LHSSIRF